MKKQQTLLKYPIVKDEFQKKIHRYPLLQKADEERAGWAARRPKEAEQMAAEAKSSPSLAWLLVFCMVC